MSILPFYRVDFPVELIPNEFTVVNHGKSRTEEGRLSKVGQPEFEAVKRLIISEKSGWRYDLTTYAPNVEFYSPHMKVNCMDSSVAVNFQSGTNGDWVQISKKNLKSNCSAIE